MKTVVAMASYNGEQYIEEQLCSIAEQTRPVDGVLICDDVSSDATVEVANRFIEKNNLRNWVVRVNGKNLGYIENFRNAMDAIIDGDVLVFLADQDDIWEKNRVEIMADTMERNSQIGLLTTEHVSFRNGETPWLSPSDRCGNASPKPIRLTPHTRYLRSLGSEMVYRNDFYRKIRENWYHGWAHDEFLWSLAVLLGSGYSLEYPSIYRRIHETQVSGHFGHDKQKRIRYLRDLIQSSTCLMELAKRNKMPEKTVRLFEKNVKTHRLRLELIHDRKITDIFRLIPYIRYYYTPKSYLVEAWMAWKGGKT